MRRLGSPSPIAILAAVVASALLAGCGRAGIAGAPVMKATGSSSVKTVTRPVTTPTTTGTGTSTASFLTQLGASAPTFSPRGDRLVFSTPTRGVLLANPDATNPQVFPGSQPGDHDPAWSATGDAIVVVRAGGAGNQLIKLSSAGGKGALLFGAAATLSKPCWLPSGTGIVVAVAGANGELLRWDAATGKAGVLWQGAGAGAPTSAPDGKSIVFEAQGGLARISIAGGTASSLTVTGTHPRSPHLSASGKSLAYVADDGLYVALPDGSQGRRMAAGSGYDTPAWNPLLPQLLVAATVGGRTDIQRIALP